MTPCHKYNPSSRRLHEGNFGGMWPDKTPSPASFCLPDMREPESLARTTQAAGRSAQRPSLGRSRRCRHPRRPIRGRLTVTLLQQTKLLGLEHGLTSARDMQLLEDVLHVRTHGPNRDGETFAISLSYRRRLSPCRGGASNVASCSGRSGCTANWPSLSSEKAILRLYNCRMCRSDQI